MLKFFRKIRQKLLEEHKTSKYLLYAIGEIALVMIGILLALQVNNWNENNKDRKTEKVVLTDLHTEFQNNLIKLKSNKVQYEESKKAIQLLTSLIGASKTDLENHNLDSLLAKSIDVFDYRPTQNTLTEILASGKLNLITATDLKTELFKWSADLEEKKEAWQTLDDFNQSLFIPYLTKQISMKNIDNYGLVNWNQKSILEVEYHPVFQQLEFENHLDNHIWG
ncbi:MAG: DUF6090 family protein, partial [Maribacter sp.]